jgi:Effector Associated Constant Component 1
VEVRVTLDGADGGGLESLDDWLRQDTRLAGHVRLVAPPPRRGVMGAAADALVVEVGSGGTLSVLAWSLHAWLSQPRRSAIKVRIEGADGRVVDIAADRVDAKQTEAILDRAFGSEATGP